MYPHTPTHPTMNIAEVLFWGVVLAGFFIVFFFLNYIVP